MKFDEKHRNLVRVATNFATLKNYPNKKGVSLRKN